MQFLDKLEKFTFQIWNFLLYKNLEMFQVNWEFFQPIVKKNRYCQLDPVMYTCIEKSPNN